MRVTDDVNRTVGFCLKVSSPQCRLVFGAGINFPVIVLQLYTKLGHLYCSRNGSMRI